MSDRAIKQKRLQALVDELIPQKKKEISDHALLRYLERHLGLDMRKIRQELLTKDVCTSIKYGAKKIKIGGIDFRVENNTVVTII